MFLVLRGFVTFCRFPTDAARGFIQLLFVLVYKELTSLDLNIFNQKMKIQIYTSMFGELFWISHR